MNRPPVPDAPAEMYAVASGTVFRSRVLFFGVFLVLVSSFAVTWMSGDELRYDDEVRYDILANSILHKHAYEQMDGIPSASWPPGYPMAITAAYSVADRPMSAKILNVFCLTFAIFTAARLARRHHPNGMVIVPYLALCYPILLYVASALYPQTVGSLLLLGVISLASANPLSRSAAAVSGILYGLLCLTIPAFMLLCPLLLAFIVVAGRERLTDSLIKAAIVGAMAVLTVTPWTLRNFLELRAFVPVSANGGYNLALGNSAGTQPNSKPDLPSLCPPAANTTGEIAFDRAMTHCATTWITEHPARAATLYVLKLLNYFNYRNNLDSQANVRPWMNWVMFATYYPLLLLAVARIGFQRRFPFSRTEALLYLFYFGNALASAVFFTRIRFRIPFDLLLVVIDSIFLARLFDLLHSRRSASRRHS